MAKILTKPEHYSAIATALRTAMNDESRKYRPSTMAEGVAEACNTRYEMGKDEGMELAVDGFYNLFWDEYQNYGQPMSGHMLFAGKGWTSNNFRPVHKEVSYTSGYMCFRNNQAVTDMSDWSIDLSAAGDCSYLFHTCKHVTHIGKIVMPTGPYSSGTNYLFTWCNRLHTIDELAWNANIIESKSAFLMCVALVNITFTGTIGCSLDFGDCSKLSRDSITNIVNCLSPYTSGQTITFSKGAVNSKFTTAEWNTLIGTKTNWNFSLI